MKKGDQKIRLIPLKYSENDFERVVLRVEKTGNKGLNIR
jgi:hypothetical protein